MTGLLAGGIGPSTTDLRSLLLLVVPKAMAAYRPISTQVRTHEPLRPGVEVEVELDGLGKIVAWLDPDYASRLRLEDQIHELVRYLEEQAHHEMSPWAWLIFTETGELP